MEKLVAKIQKKIAGASATEDDDAVADAEESTEQDGAKEPTHSESSSAFSRVKCQRLIQASAVAISGEASGPDTVQDDGSQLPSDASPNEEVKHVDSALEEILEEQK